MKRTINQNLMRLGDILKFWWQKITSFKVYSMASNDLANDVTKILEPQWDKNKIFKFNQMRRIWRFQQQIINFGHVKTAQAKLVDGWTYWPSSELVVPLPLNLRLEFMIKALLLCTLKHWIIVTCDS
jgi:hypothetical protein